MSYGCLGFGLFSNESQNILRLQHDPLISILNSIIDFCFNGGECDYLSINDFGAKWVKDPSSSDQVFDKRRVKGCIKYLLNNCFFTVGNYLFRQQIGIPMGSDPRLLKPGNLVKHLLMTCALLMMVVNFKNLTGKLTQKKCSLAKKTRTIKSIISRPWYFYRK